VNPASTAAAVPLRPVRPARPVLVTGGAGFLGCNIADRLASAGTRVLVLDSLARPGVEANLAWLKGRHGPLVEASLADVRDPRPAARPCAGPGRCSTSRRRWR
jgi:CDP-paratose 2-epimerase